MNPVEIATSIDLSNGLDWRRWLNGDCPEVVTVAILSPHVASLVGASSRAVLASRHCIMKVRHKHGMNEVEAMRIMDAAAHGAIVWASAKPAAYQFHYRDQASGRRYKLVLKAIPGSSEVWLSTFFHSDERTFRAAVRKGRLLKE